MLTELCGYLKNWFEVDAIFGDIMILNGMIVGVGGKIKPDQYYRIIGSIFNDGVYQYGHETLKDENFEGAIWLMAVPQEVIDLSKEIDEWNAKYGGVDSEAMSPFTSESFGGYSYSKGSSSGDSASQNTWQGAFAARLSRWKKI